LNLQLKLKFADLQKTLENNVILGTASYPKTLNEAYTIAQNIRVVSEGSLKAAEIPQTAFVVSASLSKPKHKAHKKPNIVGGFVTTDADSSTNTGSDKNKKKEPGPCRLYGDGSRHWAGGPECKFKKNPQPKSNGSNSGGRSDESEWSTLRIQNHQEWCSLLLIK
jgi:hypothetical protein